MKGTYRLSTQEAAKYLIKHLHPDLDGVKIEAKLGQGEIIIKWIAEDSEIEWHNEGESDTHTVLEAEVERLKFEIEHLRRCKEFESNLQRELLKVGEKYLSWPDGKTFDVRHAWRAIQYNLAQLPLNQRAYLTPTGEFI